MKTGHIYGLASSKDEVIKYIGATKKILSQRLSGHLYESKNKKSKSNKDLWIYDEINSGFKINIIELDSVDILELHKNECNYIKLFRSFGANLVNSNDGGKGYNPIKSVVEKISSYRKGNKLAPEHYKNLCESNKRRRIRNPKINTGPRLKPVDQLDLNGNYIKSWESIRSACDSLKLSSGSIVKCCNPHRNYVQKHKTCGGFKWRYSQKQLTEKSGNSYLNQN